MSDTFDSRYITAPDGLRLYVRDYGDRRSARLPVLCLAGLSRNSADFDAVATALASDPDAPRRVVALDCRGRGRSDYDPDPEHYAIPVERDDVIAVMTALDIAPAILIGTSRGGLITMDLATKAPDLIAGAILNDVGPAVEIAGLLRIQAYVGKRPAPASFEDGAELLRQESMGQFPRLGPADWLATARRAWREENGRLVTNYDPALSRILAQVRPDKGLPTMWKEFEALNAKKVMVIRGLRSDILSAATVAEMQTRHPALEILEVPDQGHTPLLADPLSIGRIAAFAAACDAARDSRPAGT